MPNPFEDDLGRFFALRNDEGQYSLWPVFAPVPEGWVVATGPSTRSECLAHIDDQWRDLRPLSLIAAMEGERTT